MPSILIMFFDAKKTLRVKFEGVDEIIKGVRRFVAILANSGICIAK